MPQMSASLLRRSVMTPSAKSCEDQNYFDHAFCSQMRARSRRLTPTLCSPPFPPAPGIYLYVLLQRTSLLGHSLKNLAFAFLLRTSLGSQVPPPDLSLSRCGPHCGVGAGPSC